MEIHETVKNLIQESRRFEGVGELTAAIRQAKQAMRLAISLADLEGESDAMIALAHAYLRLGSYSDAHHLCEQVLKIAGEESPARADALLYLGTCASETDDIDLAEDYYRRAIDFTRQIGYDRALIIGLHDLSAGVYMPKGQFALSLAAEEEALNLARHCGMPGLAWGPLTTTSYDYWLLGQRDKAETSLLALQQVATPGSVGEAYMNVIRANLHLEAGNFSDAKSLLDQTRTNAEISGVVEVNFIVRIGLSRLNRLQGNPSAALDWATDGYTLVNRIGYRHLQGVALIERGRAAWEVGDLPAAEADFVSAIQLMAPMKLNYDLAKAAFLLAVFYHQQERVEAPAAWREAVQRISQGGFGFLLDSERSLALPVVAAYLNHSDPKISAATASLLDILQRLPPAHLKITTMGGFEIQVGMRVVEKSALRQRKAGELLAMLLLSQNHTLAGDQIIEALWPERDPEAALSFLHQATSGLRRALEPELPEKFPSRYLKVEEGQVTLALPPESLIDYEAFETCCQKNDWQVALSLYTGEFLPNFLYAGWAVMQRQRLAYLYQQALLNQAEIWLKLSQFSLALDACRRVLALEPWQEQAALIGMKASLGLEDRAAARRIYRHLEKCLGEELQIKPQEELQKYYQSI
jgi:DNA-binding SARP family transcriptional activator